MGLKLGSICLAWYVGIGTCEAFDGDGVPEQVTVHHANWVAVTQVDSVDLKVRMPRWTVRFVTTMLGLREVANL